jgi:hypothetical protein
LLTEDRTETAIERWTDILSRSIERIVERQQRVVLEKASGAKARKSLMSGTLDIDSILSKDTWNKQIDDDIKPVLSAIINDSYELRSEKSNEHGMKVKTLQPFDVVKNIESHLLRIKKVNDMFFSDINSIMLKSFEFAEEDRRVLSFREGLIDMYANFFAKEQFEIAEMGARDMWNFAQVA